MWERELDELRRKTGNVVKDTVRGSSSDYPYTEHPVTITGMPKRGRSYETKEQRYDRRVMELNAELLQIEAYIDSLQDSQLRQIIHYRYVKGYSWAKVARMIGGKNTEDAVKKRVYRHFARKSA